MLASAYTWVKQIHGELSTQSAVTKSGPDGGIAHIRRPRDIHDVRQHRRVLESARIEDGKRAKLAKAEATVAQREPSADVNFHKLGGAPVEDASLSGGLPAVGLRPSDVRRIGDQRPVHGPEPDAGVVRCR